MSDPNRPRQSPSGANHRRQDDSRGAWNDSRAPESRHRDDSSRSSSDSSRSSRHDDRRDSGSRSPSGDRYAEVGARKPASRTRPVRKDDEWNDPNWSPEPSRSRDGGKRSSGDGWGDDRSAGRHSSSADRRRSDDRNGHSGGPRDWEDRRWEDSAAWLPGIKSGSNGSDSRSRDDRGSRRSSRSRSDDRRGSGSRGDRSGRRDFAARANDAWRDVTSQFDDWKEATSMLAASMAEPKTFRERLRTDKKARVIAIVMLVVILFCMIPTPILAYTNTMGLAKDGQAQLKAAENDFKTLANSPTNIALINDAQMHLQNAHNDFFQLQVRLVPLTPLGALPKVGSKVSGAAKLVPLAVEGTQAGVLACDALKTLIIGLKNPLGTTGGLTAAGLAQVASDMDQVQALFNQMTPQIMGLTQADLSLAPTLWPTILMVQSKLGEVTPLVSDMDGLAHALPSLLGVGAPSSYLVEVLDSSELRPTGGFIGNFGVLTIDHGRIAPLKIRDITLIDSSVKFDPTQVAVTSFIPIPDRYDWLKSVFADPSNASWSLRDSNLDPNYPTVAEYALQIYPELLPYAQQNLDAQNANIKLYDPAKDGKFAGVVTLSLGFFAKALDVTGSLQIDDHSIHDTVDSSNFVAKIHNYSLNPALSQGYDNQACGDTSCSKIFTSDVVKAFIDKIKSNLPLYIGRMGKLAYESLKAKDIEIYVTQPDAEKTLQDLHIAGTVAAPATGDSVFEVDTNIGANKDNAFLQYTMGDQITLDNAGPATHQLDWSYYWPNIPATPDVPTSNPNLYPNQSYAAGSPTYHSYSRVFVPPDATFISQHGFNYINTVSDFGRTSFGSDAYATFLNTSKYGMSWSAPTAVTHDATGYHYHLIWQRESGIVWPLTIAVTLPSCVSTATLPVASGLGKTDKMTVAGNVVTITTQLSQDEQFQFDWKC